MAGKPLAPSSIYSFTNHSTTQPTVPQPGDQLDASLQQEYTFDAQVMDWVATTIADDGSIRAGVITESMLVPFVWDGLLTEAEAQLQPYVDQAAASATAALNSQTVAQNAATSANSAASGVAANATAAANSATTAQTAATAAQDASNLAVTAGTDAGNDANAASQSAAAAAISEQNAENWADYLSGPIPGIPPEDNHASVDDGRFSSAWWSIRAEQFGGDAADASQSALLAKQAAEDAQAAAEAAKAAADAAAAQADQIASDFEGIYYGPFAVPPTLDHLGQPPDEGDMYFDTTANAMRVWDGTTWAPFTGTADIPVAADIVTAPIANVTGGNVQLNLASIQANLEAHAGAADPYPQYLTAAEGDASYLTPAAGDARYLTPAGGDALFLTPAEGDASYLQPATALALYLQKAGDTMAGPLTLAGAPVNPLEATTKAYVDSRAYTSPLTAKGDIFVRDGGADARLPAGLIGQSLVADSSQAVGLKYSPLMKLDDADGARFSYAGLGSQISLQRGTETIGRIAMQAESAGVNYLMLQVGAKVGADGLSWTAEKTTGCLVYAGNGPNAFGVAAFTGGTIGAGVPWSTWFTVQQNGHATFHGADALRLPSGTTAQRVSQTAGDIRYNTTIGQPECYNGTVWNTMTPVGGYLPLAGGTLNGLLQIQSGIALIRFYANNAPAQQRAWNFFANTDGTWLLQPMDDAQNTAQAQFTFKRNGNVEVTGAYGRSGGASSQYGSIDVVGSKGAYAGINFADVGMVLMMQGPSGYSGFCDPAGNWSLQVNNGNLVMTGNVTAYSDGKVKKNIAPIRDAIAKVRRLLGVVYDRTDLDLRQIGLVAQAVEPVVPEVVQHNEQGLSIAYGNLTALLIEAIKDIDSRLLAMERTAHVAN